MTRWLWWSVCWPVVVWAQPEAGSLEQQIARGEAAYAAHCQACHQATGRGSGYFLPSLREEPGLLGDKERLIATILNGKFDRAGEYQGHAIPLMPMWDYLGNERIADIITFMSASWSDSPIVVTAEEVARQRGLLMWDDEESADRAPPSPGDVDKRPIPLTGPEFERANSIYYSRCVGCHGVQRDGTVGAPLLAWFMRERGRAYLQSVINYGSHKGMPAWGSTEQLSAQDMSILARYLQMPVPPAPPFTQTEVKASWWLPVTVAERPKRKAHQLEVTHLFAAALHDTGEVLLIDGDSKNVFASVFVGYSPHGMALSPDDRYLYVIGRDGVVSAIDLYSDKPRKVAEVRVGFEARALAAQKARGFPSGVVVAGAYAPGQFSVLDGRTLEPLSTRPLLAGSEPRKVSDLVALDNGKVFMSSTDDERVHVVDVRNPREPVVRSHAAPRFLRPGSRDASGRYVLATADDGRIVVFDSKAGDLVATLVTPELRGGSRGTMIEHPRMGPLWVTSSLVSDALIAVGADPRRHRDMAWQIVYRLKGPGGGSLYVQGHPDSSNLWVDTPLNAESAISQSVGVFDIADLESGYERLPIAEWADLGPGVKRVLHPQFDASGREVWFVVWNPQNLTSAIVVVADRTRTLEAVIKDNRLITPIRNFSLAALVD